MSQFSRDSCGRVNVQHPTDTAVGGVEERQVWSWALAESYLPGQPAGRDLPDPTAEQFRWTFHIWQHPNVTRTQGEYNSVMLGP